MNNTVKKKTDRDVGTDETSAVPDVSGHATPSSAGALYGVEVGQLNRQVKRNLEVSGIPYHEWNTSEMEVFAAGLSEMNGDRGWNYDLATCGEKINLRQFGIGHNRCIDGDLIARLAWDDQVLMDFMGVKIEDMPQPSLFGESSLPEGAIELPGGHFFVSRHKKDSGQRLFCECMASKDIGEYNTCPHLCEYCYANSTKQTALDNWRKHKLNPFSDTITGG